MMNKRQLSIKNIWLICIVLACSFNMTPELAHTQSRLHSPVNHALGGGGTAYIDSYQANFVNPANLMLNSGRDTRFTIGILGSTGGSLGGSLANINVYNQYLTSGLAIQDDLASEMLTKWFGTADEEVRSFGLSADHIPLGFAYRNEKWGMAFAARSRLIANASPNKGVAELFIHGPDPQYFSSGKPVNLKIESLVFTEISFGIAGTSSILSEIVDSGRNTKFYVGAAPKLILSQHSGKFDLQSNLQVQPAGTSQNARIYHDFNYLMEFSGSTARQLNQYQYDRRILNQDVSMDDYLEFSGSDFYGFQSAGFGIDLGATVEMNMNGILPDAGVFRGDKFLRISLSLNDLGIVRFGKNSNVFRGSGVVDWRGIEHNQETIDQHFNGDTGAYYESVLKDSIGSDIYGNFRTLENETVSRNLPASLNAGAHLKAGRFGLMLDAGKGFNNVGINSRRIYASLGTEYRFFGIWPLRAGIRTGGFSSSSLHFGTGLEFRNFEFSFSGSTVPSSGRYGSAAGAAWSGIIIHF
jgi:hypothetical protein